MTFRSNNQIVGLVQSRLSRLVELIGLQSPAGDPIFPCDRRVISRFRVPRVARLKRKCPCRGGFRETRTGTIVCHIRVAGAIIR
jgi:hypothetical protein